MKTRNLFYLIAMAFISINVILTSCGKEDEDIDNGDGDTDLPAGTTYGIKSGTVTYSNNIILIFDDYGKKCRLEVGEGEDKSISINNELTGKYYLLNPSTKIAYETSTGQAFTAFIYYGDDVNSIWASYPGFGKGQETIAGKNCSVCKWRVDNCLYEYGGWKRIITLTKDCEEEFRAISISETTPSADNFVLPEGYTVYR